MRTSNRILFLTNYISKKELYTYLEISKKSFDLYISENRWKFYQIEKINKIFEYVKNIVMDKSKEIQKIYFENRQICVEVKEKKL